MLRRFLDALLTFPDFRGRRWGTWRAFRVSYKNRPVLVRGFTIALTLVAGAGIVCGVLFCLFVNTEAELLEMARGFLYALPINLFIVAGIMRLCVPDARRHLLSRDICPACGYSLAGLEPHSPVTCPECGASWQRGDKSSPR